MSAVAAAALSLSLFLAGDAEVANGVDDAQRFGFTAWGCGSRVSSEWRQHDGRVVAEEKLDLADGRWVRYRLQRHNVGQEVVAVRAGREVELTILQGQSRRQVTLRPTGDLLAGPTLVSHLGDALPTLRAGRPVEFDYLVAEQGMILRLRASAAARGTGETVVKVEAASVLLRPFVPVTTLLFDATGDLRSLAGRLLPQAGDVGKAKSLDGVLRIRSTAVAGTASRKQSICNTADLS